MWKIARVLTGFVAVVAVSGQYLGVGKPVQPAASPVRRAEPRVGVMEDPLVLFQSLTGSSSANRRRALLDLG
jgi:hypothetical protein